MKKILSQIVLMYFITFSSNGQGPKTPPCGIFEVMSNEVIAGVQFPKGNYKINVIGIACEEVMGDSGLFIQFLNLQDNDQLPEPWRYLKAAVGAPKFVKGPGVGFRVERVYD
jgi:hypothetical protein